MAESSNIMAESSNNGGTNVNKLKVSSLQR